MNMKPLLAIAAVALLAAAGLAAVNAEPGKGKGDERREKAMEARDKVHEKCAAAEDNSTLEKRCEMAKKAIKARREAHALVRAIEAHERLLERIEQRIDRLEAYLAAGNFTGNQTAEDVQDRIEKLEDRADHVEERILKLQQKLDRLHAKWEEVRDHVGERRGARGPASNSTV